MAAETAVRSYAAYPWASAGMLQKVTFEAASARGFDKVHDRVDAASREVGIIHRVRRDAADVGPVNRLEIAPKEIVRDVPRALDAAGADDVEKLRRKLRKRRADAPARNHHRAASLEEVGKLPHPVEVRLQAGEKH